MTTRYMSEQETLVQEEFAKLGIITFANPTLEQEEEINNIELEEKIATLAEYCNQEETIVRGKVENLGIAGGFLDKDVFVIQVDNGKDVILIYNKSGKNINISTGDRLRSYYSREHIGRLYKEDARLFKNAVDALNNEII